MYGGDITNQAKQAYLRLRHENMRRVTLRLGCKQYGAQTFAGLAG